MAMTWKSLDLLRQNLGGVGEGVTNYLKGRQEDEERQNNFQALQQYSQSPEGKQALGPNPGSMMGLAFAGSNYRALPAIQAMQPKTQILSGAGPGQYKVASTPSMGGLPTISNAQGPGQGSTAPEDVEYDPNTGVPYGIKTPEELAMYKGNMERLKSQGDAYNATPEGKANPKAFHPKLAGGLEAANSTLAVLNKQRAENLAMALGNKKAFEEYKVNDLKPQQDQAALDLYAKKLKLKTSSDMSTMDPTMIEREGRKYYATGQMPAMGMGNAPVRNAIMLRAAQIGQQEGETNPEAKTALYQSHQKAYAALVTQAGQIGAREKGAERNLDMALQMSKAYPRTSFPRFNRFQNWAAENVDNNPKYTQLENAVYAASREYAKVASGAMGNAPLSDQAMKDVDRLLNTSQTYEQFEAAVSTMRRDLRNVPAGFEDQLKIQRDLLTSFGKQNAPGAAPSGPPAGARVRKYNPQTQGFE